MLLWTGYRQLKTPENFQDFFKRDKYSCNISSVAPKSTSKKALDALDGSLH